MNFLERMVLKKMINKLIQQYVFGFINRYPKQAHIAAVVLGILAAIYTESKTAQHLVAQGESLIPHGAAIAAFLGTSVLAYLNAEK